MEVREACHLMCLHWLLIGAAVRFSHAPCRLVEGTGEEGGEVFLRQAEEEETILARLMMGGGA